MLPLRLKPSELILSVPVTFQTTVKTRVCPLRVTRVTTISKLPAVVPLVMTCQVQITLTPYDVLQTAGDLSLVYAPTSSS